MLFHLNKHFKKNFKNFIISQYCLNLKAFNLEQNLYIKINFLKNSFFLATFLLYSFCIFKFKFKKTLNNFNLIVPIFFFFSIFIKICYPYLKNLNIFLKKSKKLISLVFNLNNFLILPISIFFKKIILNATNNIILYINFFFKKNTYKYICFFLNFFQLPIFNKNVI